MATLTLSTRSGIFPYKFETRGEALDAARRARDDERTRRPRQRKVGRDTWLLDHPRQRSIYPLTVKVTDN